MDRLKELNISITVVHHDVINMKTLTDDIQKIYDEICNASGVVHTETNMDITQGTYEPVTNMESLFKQCPHWDKCGGEK